MKKIGIILLLTSMVFQGFSQEVSEKELNNKELLENGTKVNIERYSVENRRDEDDNKDSHERNARRFKGHWAGVGLNWNNYVFSGNNNIQVGDNGVIEELIPVETVPLKKSKFTTLYLNIPAILELQLPTGEGHCLNIGAGVIGGIKLGSHTKMIFEDGRKFKSNRDLNMNILRGGVTGRIGYENFMIYGTYYLTPWFQEGKGPGYCALEPFEIGLAFTFND